MGAVKPCATVTPPNINDKWNSSLHPAKRTPGHTDTFAHWKRAGNHHSISLSHCGHSSGCRACVSLSYTHTCVMAVGCAGLYIYICITASSDGSFFHTSGVFNAIMPHVGPLLLRLFVSHHLVEWMTHILWAQGYFLMAPPSHVCVNVSAKLKVGNLYVDAAVHKWMMNRYTCSPILSLCLSPSPLSSSACVAVWLAWWLCVWLLYEGSRAGKGGWCRTVRVWDRWCVVCWAHPSGPAVQYTLCRINTYTLYRSAVSSRFEGPHTAQFNLKWAEPVKLLYVNPTMNTQYIFAIIKDLFTVTN